MSLPRKIILSCFIPAWLIAFCLIFPAFAFSVTTTSLLAFAGLLAILALLLVCVFYGLPWSFRNSGRTWLWFGALFMAHLPALDAIMMAPPGKGGGGSLVVEHCFVDEYERFVRICPANVVPEVDQIAFGINLARYGDALVDSAKAQRVRDLVIPIYNEMYADPRFAQMGSVLSRGYAEMAGASPKGGHYVAIVPRISLKRPLPLVIFLHGSGGNFSSHWYVLSKLAEKYRVAVVCPTFGFGNWQRPGAMRAIAACMLDASKRYYITTDRMYLAGISNGGRGVTRAVKSFAGAFRGVILISSVLEEEIIREGIRNDAWQGLPVMLIHGEQDLRIPPQSIESAVSVMAMGKARQTFDIYPDEDHFLFYSQREEIIDSIGEWIGLQEKNRTETNREK